MLVISSQTQSVYRHHKAIWETYMKSHPDIECYFIEFSPVVLSPLLTSTTLFLRGHDTYQTILDKTFRAIDFFTRHKQYDYVIRTNLSSVWIFPRLIRFLETAPRTGLYGGIINNNQPWAYISGAGITLSWDVVQILLKNRHLAYASKVIDDVLHFHEEFFLSLNRKHLYSHAAQNAGLKARSRAYFQDFLSPFQLKQLGLKSNGDWM